MTQATRDDVGTICWYFDPYGRRYDALITAVWGPQCINVVIVNHVEGQTDSYGQKLQRWTSVSHGLLVQAHGNFWLKVGEERPAHTTPGYYSSPEQRARAHEADSSLD